MLEQNILDKIVNFFKSLGTKPASGEPLDLSKFGRVERDFKSDRKEVLIRHDIPVKIEKQTEVSPDQVIEITKEDSETASVAKVADEKMPATIEVVAKVRPKIEYSAALEALRAQYVWRKIKAEKPLQIQPLPEPFYFLTSDNQPVEASKLEVSFVKELLTKAAEAGVENKFTFSLSSTMSVVVKYKKKLVGRVYLHGKKHSMSFKVDGKTILEEQLSLSECKKLIVVWIGQIKDSQTAV